MPHKPPRARRTGHQDACQCQRQNGFRPPRRMKGHTILIKNSRSSMSLSPSRGPLFANCVLLISGVALGASPVQIAVSNQKDTSVGLNGRLSLFLSTSFQPADWDYPFFQNFPGQTKVLWQLAPQHINLQSIVGALPQTSP